MRYRWFNRSNQTIFQLIAATFILAFSLLLGSCSIGPDKMLGEAEIEVEKISILPVADSPQMPAVIKRLMDLADEQYHQAKISDAITTLERAIRIKPHFPEIWSRMAFIYAHQGKLIQAQQYAQRSNSYITPTHPLKTFNDDLIHSANR